MEDRKLDSLRQQNGRLRSIVKDKLGEGTWGLVNLSDAKTLHMIYSLGGLLKGL